MGNSPSQSGFHPHPGLPPGSDSQVSQHLPPSQSTSHNNAPNTVQTGSTSSRSSCLHSGPFSKPNLENPPDPLLNRNSSLKSNSTPIQFSELMINKNVSWDESDQPHSMDSLALDSSSSLQSGDISPSSLSPEIFKHSNTKYTGQHLVTNTQSVRNTNTSDLSEPVVQGYEIRDELDVLNHYDSLEEPYLHVGDSDTSRNSTLTPSETPTNKSNCVEPIQKSSTLENITLEGIGGTPLTISSSVNNNRASESCQMVKNERNSAELHGKSDNEISVENASPSSSGFISEPDAPQNPETIQGTWELGIENCSQLKPSLHDINPSLDPCSVHIPEKVQSTPAQNQNQSEHYLDQTKESIFANSKGADEVNVVKHESVTNIISAINNVEPCNAVECGKNKPEDALAPQNHNASSANCSTSTSTPNPLTNLQFTTVDKKLMPNDNNLNPTPNIEHISETLSPPAPNKNHKRSESVVGYNLIFIDGKNPEDDRATMPKDPVCSPTLQYTKNSKNPDAADNGPPALIKDYPENQLTGPSASANELEGKNKFSPASRQTLPKPVGKATQRKLMMVSESLDEFETLEAQASLDKPTELPNAPISTSKPFPNKAKQNTAENEGIILPLPIDNAIITKSNTNPNVPPFVKPNDIFLEDHFPSKIGNDRVTFMDEVRVRKYVDSETDGDSFCDYSHGRVHSSQDREILEESINFHKEASKLIEEIIGKQTLLGKQQNTEDIDDPEEYKGTTILNVNTNTLGNSYLSNKANEPLPNEKRRINVNPIYQEDNPQDLERGNPAVNSPFIVPPTNTIAVPIRPPKVSEAERRIKSTPIFSNFPENKELNDSKRTETKKHISKVYVSSEALNMESDTANVGTDYSTPTSFAKSKRESTDKSFIRSVKLESSESSQLSHKIQEPWSPLNKSEDYFVNFNNVKKASDNLKNAFSPPDMKNEANIFKNNSSRFAGGRTTKSENVVNFMKTEPNSSISSNECSLVVLPKNQRTSTSDAIFQEMRRKQAFGEENGHSLPKSCRRDVKEKKVTVVPKLSYTLSCSSQNPNRLPIKPIMSMEIEKAETEPNYTKVLAEYEKTLSMYIQKVEDMKLKVDEAGDEKLALIKERDQALEDLRNVESAFSDVHRKYERSKGVLINLKTNEDTLIRRDQELIQKIQNRDKKMEALKEKAQDSLEQMHSDYENRIRDLESENTRLRAQFRKMEMKLETLENDVEQKSKENAQLSALCDELINGQVTN